MVDNTGRGQPLVGPAGIYRRCAEYAAGTDRCLAHHRSATFTTRAAIAMKSVIEIANLSDSPVDLRNVALTERCALPALPKAARSFCRLGRIVGVVENIDDFRRATATT